LLFIAYFYNCYWNITYLYLLYKTFLLYKVFWHIVGLHWCTYLWKNRSSAFANEVYDISYTIIYIIIDTLWRSWICLRFMWEFNIILKTLISRRDSNINDDVVFYYLNIIIILLLFCFNPNIFFLCVIVHKWMQFKSLSLTPKQMTSK